MCLMPPQRHGRLKKNQCRLQNEDSKVAEWFVFFPSSFSIFHLISTHKLHTLHLRTQWAQNLYYFQHDCKQLSQSHKQRNAAPISSSLRAVFRRTLPYRGPGFPKTVTPWPWEWGDGRETGGRWGQNRDLSAAPSVSHNGPTWFSFYGAFPSSCHWRTFSTALRSLPTPTQTLKTAVPFLPERVCYTAWKRKCLQQHTIKITHQESISPEGLSCGSSVSTLGIPSLQRVPIPV